MPYFLLRLRGRVFIRFLVRPPSKGWSKSMKKDAKYDSIASIEFQQKFQSGNTLNWHCLTTHWATFSRPIPKMWTHSPSISQIPTSKLHLRGRLNLSFLRESRPLPPVLFTSSWSRWKYLLRKYCMMLWSWVACVSCGLQCYQSRSPVCFLFAMTLLHLLH